MPADAIPWRRNLAIAVAAIAVDGFALRLASHPAAWWQVAAAALLFSYANHCLFALGHEAVHGVLLPWRRGNEWLGSLLAASFPQSFCLQRAFHLCHHRRN